MHGSHAERLHMQRASSGPSRVRGEGVISMTKVEWWAVVEVILGLSRDGMAGGEAKGVDGYKIKSKDSPRLAPTGVGGIDRCPHLCHHLSSNLVPCFLSAGEPPREQTEGRRSFVFPAGPASCLSSDQRAASSQPCLLLPWGHRIQYRMRPCGGFCFGFYFFYLFFFPSLSASGSRLSSSRRSGSDICSQSVLSSSFVHMPWATHLASIPLPSDLPRPIIVHPI